MHVSDPPSPTSPEALQSLREEIKQLLITTLHLEDVTPSDIGDTEALFSPTARLSLDSLAALELLAAIEFTYEVRFGDDGSAREHFRSVATLADFVAAARG